MTEEEERERNVAYLARGIPRHVSITREEDDTGWSFTIIAYFDGLLPALMARVHDGDIAAVGSQDAHVLTALRAVLSIAAEWGTNTADGVVPPGWVKLDNGLHVRDNDAAN